MGRYLAGLMFLLSLTGQVCGVSFYGNGFISLRPAGETFNQTSLRMRFRTPKEHGLLFLALGRRDFLLLELVFGRLQVHFDFGSGEHVLLSENPVYVSDLAWHSVAVRHIRHNITMTVDRTSHSSLHIPGPDLELSVGVEISVGGSAMYPQHLLNASKDPPLLKTRSGFRGCLEEAIFNERNLLSVRQQDGSLRSHRTSLGCSQEFSASESDSISFFSHKAFMSLPQWEVTQEGVFACELYPSEREEDGVVMYSAGVRGAFVALEIRKGHLVAIAGTSEEKRTELHSLTHLHSSLKWYPVQVHLLQHSVQLNVGKESIKANLGAALRSVQLQGPLYVGGMDTHAWLKFRGSRNVKQYRGSFKGCVRDIRVNNVPAGLPHALVTQDITVGCKTEQDSPELSISTADHQELDSHLTDHTSDGTNLLLLRKLEVAEGGWALLEPKHIKVNLDFRTLGLHPSKLMFHIKQQPVHGQIRLDRGQARDDQPKEEAEKAVGGERERSFSMLDLWQGGVMYLHSGSEDREDSFMFSVSSSNKAVLVEDQHLHRFVIQIVPVNDAPVLSLPEGNIFTLLEASSRQLTKNVLSVSDPDSSNDDLIFSPAGDLFMEAGYLEHRSHHGRPILQFSLPDLVDGNILFVHTKAPNSTLAMRVSDGEKVSNTVVLRIVAVALDYRLVNNTGLEVQQGGSTLITTRNLAVGTNAVHQAVLISYEVTEFPKYGSLQRLHSSGDWKPATTFSQKLLHKERVRYTSTYRGPQMHSNVTDQFKCKMSISWRASEEVVVPIVVHWIQLNVTRSKMEMNGVQSAIITSENLRVISKGFYRNDSEVYFRLVSTPRKGHLFLVDTVLHINSTFSQKNITDGTVRYKLLSPSLNDSRDSFSFQVLSSYIQSLNHDFRINIKPASNITVVNRGFSVMEGESKVITKETLFTETSRKREVRYIVTVSPRHGHLRRINHSNSSSFSDDIMSFTNQDIAEERVLYVHDDSETKMDSFSFKIVLPQLRQDTNDVENQRTVNISVKLVNDQRPVRVINKVFRVARDGRRLLTSDDLRYRDDDSDFEDGWLVYTRRGIPMGELVLASDTSHKVYEFTQRDLEQKKLLFIHRGVSSGRFVLFVSDGKHYVSTLLEVVAQDPYLKLQRNTGLMVQQGGVINVTSDHLNVISNLDIRDPKEMIFRVFLPPKHGVLYFNDVADQTELLPITKFTRGDLSSGRLSYGHGGGWGSSDGFNVTARAAEAVAVRQGSKGRWDVHLDFGVSIKIYQESHQRPLTIISNRPVVVEEGQNVSISKDHLEVIHDGSSPSDIVFRLQSLPSLGSTERIISIRGHQLLDKRVRGQPTTSFSQDDVNQGLIFYHQQVEGGTNDSILLEATNGLSKVGPIRLEVEVIPKLIPLLVSNITLDEGSSLHLTPDVIRVTSPHFSGTNILYRILVPPRHGHLEHSKIPGMPITAFTHTELERKFISYIHDGSEMLSDNFTIMANQTESMKHSAPRTVHISVTPINDESPVVTVNQGLKVWQGSLTGITVDDLSAEDSDTSVDGLEFVITPPSNGYLALQSDPSRQILNFTQSHIQSGMLVFVHSGALTGGFQFQVNDGVNFAPRQIFSTTAQTLMLALQRCHPLEVYPGSVTPISDQELRVVTNDMRDAVRNDSVVFSVTAPPKLGNLVRRSPDNSIQNISTFTQGMVNAGVVLYDQNKLESVGWSASDSFSFTASSSPAFLPAHTFNIHISYQASKHHKNHQQKTRLLNNEGVVVPEGGKVMIDKSKLDASNLLGKVHEQQRKDHTVFYRVISLPRHGTLSINGRSLTREQPDFSQSTLSKFGITYLHDDSETTLDSFTFKAWAAPSELPSSYLSRYSADASSSFSPRRSDRLLHQTSAVKMFPGPTEAVTETFNITVTPVNDQPPLLRNRAPSMKVVVGERVVVGPDNLQVEDHDTPPEELHYLVISKPNNGYLTLGERPELVTSFTQYDVNRGRLHFTQQGEPSAGVFYFNVTDGHHRPLYKLFSLEVVKPSVSMVNNTGLSLVQGRTAVILTTNQLAAQTNGRSQANITYTVTAHPTHGRIAINDLEVTTFCHDDLKLGRVVYHMTELSESEDRFQVSASAAGSGVAYGSVPPQTVVVNVRPLVYLREPVRVPSGIAVKLGKAMIDASELARISRADPVFEVLSPPKHGKLVKMTYDPNRASQVLKSFTYRDVVQGRVAIEETLSDNPGNKSVLSTTRGHAPATPLNDSFTFLLKAGNVQPAKGELHFTILPHHQMRHGVSKAEEETSRKSLTTARQPTHNRTTSEGGIEAADGGDQKKGGATPHILSNKNYNRTHHRQRPHSRGGNHTRGHGAKSGNGEEAHGGRNHDPQPNPPSDPQPGRPITLDPFPVHVEVVPRPASDPLLIILPLLACLLLIIILIVLILVFRHRKEKQARLRILQQLATVPLPPEGSPYLGRPERSPAVPSVVVTPLGSASCPASPRVPSGPRRKSLAPGMTFWGPFETSAEEVMRETEYMRGFRKARHRSLTPSLKENQYWV
ncbi:chondroitin sulfate proteoglycan 4-like [Neosynchiropus ocellatus]